MAYPRFCTKCQEIQMHNSRSQCLKCIQKDLEKNFEEWKEGKSIEEQIKELFFMIKEKQDKSILY